MTKAIQAVVASLNLTLYALLFSLCDLKAAKINVLHNRNREIMLFEFEMNHSAMEATKTPLV